MSFCSVVNCMDGRVQLPVIRYLQERFGVEYVDTVTEPGPNLILSDQADAAAIQSILRRLQISVEHHHSVGIAVVGHHGCAGNPAPKPDQLAHTRNGVQFLKKHYQGMAIIGLWVDESWEVTELGEQG